MEHQFPIDHSHAVAPVSDLQVPVEAAALDVVVAFNVMDELELDGLTELVEADDVVAEDLEDVEKNFPLLKMSWLRIQ